ncbi:MAG: hypothetical protein HQL39_11920 [Alphaproteobacteria bacterium]|nr:hypothetical protein [Alphaproteobacteria bacterium]
MGLIVALAILAPPFAAEAKPHGWQNAPGGKPSGLRGHDAPLPLAAGLPALLMVGAAAAARAYAARNGGDRS